MAEFPGFTLWTDAYLGDTGHLTTIEHGAYLLLLMAMWRAGGSLPNDDLKIAKFAHLTPAQWHRIRGTIMAFFTVNDDRITQSRLTREMEFVRRRSQRQSENAKSKSLKNNNTDEATAEPNASQMQAPTLTPTLTEDTSLRSVAPSASKERGTRLSSDWVLPKQMGEWALTQGLPRERILVEAEKMKNWSINAGRNGAKKDWFAAWKNWVQKAVDDLPKARGSPPRSGLAALTEEFKQELTEDGYLDQREKSRDLDDDARLPLLAIGHHR